MFSLDDPNVVLQRADDSLIQCYAAFFPPDRRIVPIDGHKHRLDTFAVFRALLEALDRVRACRFGIDNARMARQGRSRPDRTPSSTALRMAPSPDFLKTTKKKCII